MAEDMLKFKNIAAVSQELNGICMTKTMWMYVRYGGFFPHTMNQ